MKGKASRSYQQVADEADEEDRVVAMFSTALQAQVAKVQKEQVGKGVDYLGSIWGSIVVLIGC